MNDKDVRTCKTCGQRYAIRIFGNRFPGGKEQEEVACPWCGHDDGVVTTSGLVQIEKIDESGDIRE